MIVIMLVAALMFHMLKSEPAFSATVTTNKDQARFAAEYR